MRTDNRKVKNTILSIYFILLVTAILLATVFKSYDVFPKSAMYVLMTLLLVVVLVHFIARYFEYDSDGPNLIFTNKGLILKDLINYRQNKLQFDKNRLVDYKVNNYLLYKSLVVSYRENGNIQKESFNITLLKQRKLRYIKQSLKKILKENNKENIG